jgi:hypothetical protein
VGDTEETDTQPLEESIEEGRGLCEFVLVVSESCQNYRNDAAINQLIVLYGFLKSIGVVWFSIRFSSFTVDAFVIAVAKGRYLNI